MTDPFPHPDPRPSPPRDGDPPVDLPPAVVSDLRALFSRPLRVPVRVDEGILGAARVHAAGVRRRAWLRWGGGAAAAAAVVLLALRFGPAPGGRATLAHKPGGPTAAGLRDDQDFNGDGRVDILDAYLLARQLKAGGAPPAGSDINGDGAVNQGDVDALAARAVRLQPPAPAAPKGAIQ